MEPENLQEVEQATQEIQARLRTWLKRYENQIQTPALKSELITQTVHCLNDILMKQLIPVSSIPEVEVVQDSEDPTLVHVTFTGFEKMSPWDRDRWLSAFQQDGEEPK